MVGQVAVSAIGGDKIHRGAGLSHGEAGDGVGLDDVAQVGFK